MREMTSAAACGSEMAPAAAEMKGDDERATEMERMRMRKEEEWRKKSVVVRSEARHA